MKPRDRDSMPAGKSHHRRILLQTRDLGKRNTTTERRIATAVPVTTVSTLPSDPYHGLEVYYQTAAMLTDGILWRFRYNADDASSYKWQYVSGAAWKEETTTAENTSSAALADLATVGPSFTIPLAGQYNVDIRATAASASGITRADVGVDNNGSDSTLAQGTLGAVNYYLPLSGTRVLTFAAGATVKLQYASSAATAVQFSSRVLTIAPIRVSAS